MKSIIVFWAIILGSLSVCPAVYGQFIPYTQYYNAPLLTNPASAALTDYTQVTLHYRRSRIANYDVPSVSLIHPFYRSNGLRYGGMGVNVISQQAGPGGIYKVTGVTGTFAYVIHLNKYNHIGAGLSGGVINRRIDESAVTTDSQYNLGIYDPSLNNGEHFQTGSVTRPVINAGLSWVLTDADGLQKISLGVGAYSMNKPSFDLLEDAPGDPTSYVVSGEIALLTRGRTTLSPTFRYIYQGASSANVGVRLSYAASDSPDNGVSAGLWYKTTGALVAAVQYDAKSFIIGASMDFSMASDLDANVSNAMEVHLGWRMSRKRKPKPQATENPRKAAAPVKKPNAVTGKTTPAKSTAPVSPAPPATAPPSPPATSGPAADSMATAKRFHEILLAKPVVHFELGSYEVSAEDATLLDDVAAILKNNPRYKLKITGHSCTQGDDAVNEKVSYNRAEAVAKILVEKGVPRSQLRLAAMGSRHPIATNDTEAGRQQNRRAELEWIRK